MIHMRAAGFAFLQVGLTASALSTQVHPCPEPLAVWESTGKIRGLPGIFEMGEKYLDLRCWKEAESLFRRLLEADSNDWESRTKLIQAYQGWGKEGDAYRQIVRQRKMASAVRAWNSTFRLDKFTIAGMRVEALEKSLPDYPRVRSVRFLVVEEETGRPEFVVRMNLREKQVTLPPKPSLTGDSIAYPAYELSVRWRGVRRKYYILDNKPQYETMKNIVMQIINRKRVQP